MDGATIYTWTTGGASYAEGSFISPFYEAPSTPTTQPDTLPNVAGTTQTYEYKYRSSDVNYYYYDRWAINSGEWANAEMIWGINNKSNAIKVGKTQGHPDYNTWIDAESASTNYMPPHTVSENGANIELKDTNSLIFYAFINPYYEAPVEPNVLTHTNSALYGSYEWRYYSQTATHYLYGMYHIGNDAFFDVPTSSIQVGKSGQSDYNTWSDANTLAHPNQVVDNGTIVSLHYSGTSYSFNKPTSASWL